MNNCSFSSIAQVNCIIMLNENKFLRPCVTFSLTNCTKYGNSWCNPGSCLRLENAAERNDSVDSSKTAPQTFSKYNWSSLESMCLTRGLTVALSVLPRAATELLVVEPLEAVSERDSAGVGFWGMAGWTPSIASQWAVISRRDVAQPYC